MKSSIKNMIQKATNQTWSDWQANHPNLAKLIDEVEVKNLIAENIEDSEDFKKLKALSSENYFEEIVNIAQNIITSFLR